jgi:uncharacterized protein YukE
LTVVDVTSAQIKVGEQLSGAGSYVNGIALQLTEELDALRAKLAPLQDSWYQSQAASMYQDDMNLWNLSAQTLFGSSEGAYQAGAGVLGAIAQVLDVNNTNYVDAESSNIKTWTPTN